MNKLYTLLFSLIALVAAAEGGNTVKFPQVQHWTGTGSKKAALVIAWNNGLHMDTLVWGYRFEAPTTSAQMIEDIVKNDPRLYAAASNSSYGLYLEALGYDLDNNAAQTLRGTNGLSVAKTAAGWWLRSSAGSTLAEDANDHFHGGYDVATGKYFAHLVSDGNSDFKASNGASTHQLTDGCIDVWSYQAWGEPFVLSSYHAVPATPYYKKGVFVLNEDWFGHSSSTINHLDTDSKTWTYRAYRQANAGRTLGNTTQYTTIHGSLIFFISKQNYAETGGRLIVANAANLGEILSENTLPNGGDGRAIGFSPNSPNLAFVSTSKGVIPYQVDRKEFLPAIENINGECGRVVAAGAYLFVETAKKEVIVIHPNTLSVVRRIAKACLPTLSRDGRLWVLRDQSLVAYDPTTLEEGQSINVGAKAPSYPSFAWNAGLLFAGNRENTLYWGYGKGFSGANEVYRLNLDEEQPQAQLIYTLDGKETPFIYGAAMRLRPADDHIFLQAFKSWGDRNYNLYELDKDGKELAVYPLEEQNSWFPALPLFPDVEAPRIDFAEALPKELAVGEQKQIGFTLSDADSYESGILVNAMTFKVDQNGIQLPDNKVLEAKIEGNSLSLLGVSEGERQLVIGLRSNGQFLVEAHLVKVADTTSGISSTTIAGSLLVAAGRVVAKDLAGETLTVHDLSGRSLLHHRIVQAEETVELPAHAGVLIVRAGRLSVKVQP